MTGDPRALTIIPRTVIEVRELASMISKSGLLPEALRGQEANIIVSVLAGQELGIPPMAAIRGIHVVKGKPMLAADLMVACVQGSGLCEYFSCVEETPTSVTYETRRRGAPTPQRWTWTDEDSRRAGLTGGNHVSYPRHMRRARCKASLARDVYPDVLAGCYLPDETPQDVDGAEIIEDAEVVSDGAVEPAEAQYERMLAAIDVASFAEINEMVPALRRLTGEARAEAERRVTQRRAVLRTGGTPDVA